MKTKIILYSALIILLICFNQCKKDYPDDIPKWVKDDILKFKKVSPDCICYYAQGNNEINPSLSIYEYTINGENVYAYTWVCSSRGPHVRMLDYNNNHWNGCTGEISIDGGDMNCLEYVKLNCTSSRSIWSGTMY